MINEKLMRVEGMTCVHCEKTIGKALASVGAQNVQAAWQDGRVTLDASDASDEQLRLAVTEAGYRVVSIEAMYQPKPGNIK
jgi:copper chaperone CopZ